MAACHVVTHQLPGVPVVPDNEEKETPPGNGLSLVPSGATFVSFVMATICLTAALAAALSPALAADTAATAWSPSGVPPSRRPSEKKRKN